MLNQAQYQDKSEAYLNSHVHSQGVEFDKMQRVVQQHQYQQLLDLGCGGGHVSYHLAPFASYITSCDLSEEMVSIVTSQAQVKGLNNIQGVVGPAEKLPFSDQYFDCVISRYSAHHWQNVGQAMLEINRVLTSTGRVVIFDVIGSGNPVLDTFLQTIEMIRDPSHVRDYSVAEWSCFAEAAGFRLEAIEMQTLDLDFKTWVERMQTPEHAVNTIRYLAHMTSDEVKAYYQIQADASFTTQSMYMVLTKA